MNLARPTPTAAPPADPSFDLLIDDLLARVQAGEAVDWSAVAREHPEHAERLRSMVPALEAIGDLSGPSDPAAGGLAGEHNLVSGVLGDYRIFREVGRGGMGIVYEAEQVSLGRRVALKVLPYAGALDAKQLQRFRNEAKAAASLKHEHIVSVHAIGCERGVHFYAMEFIEGQTLAQLIQARPASEAPPAVGDGTLDYAPVAGATPTAPVALLSTQHSGPRGKEFYRTAAALIAQAADALEHAHSLGIVHRDVKPGNLLVDAAGKLWVADFGLARFGPDAGLTMSGDLLGTLRYMAPEQALSHHGLVDHRADVYALGATLYELLTGHYAVDATERAEILRQIAFEEPTPPRKQDKSIPAELETITLKCLAKNPAERYATAGDLAADLKRWLDDKPIQAKPPTLVQRTARRLRRHPKAMAAVFAALLLAAVGAAAGVVLIDRQKQRAEGAYARARLALDELSSQVIDDWLAKQPALSDDQKRFLERALGHYEWLAGHAAADAAARAGVAAAYLRVGDLRARLGQTADAGAAYGRAVELYQRLADEFPAEPAHRRALAKAHRGRGIALGRVGRTGEAESAFRQALAAHEHSAGPSPAAAEDRYELAGTLLEYGDLQARVESGTMDLARVGRRMPKAEATYRRGLDLMRVSADGPPAFRHRLAQLQIHLGTCHLGQAEGERFYRRGIELLEGLEQEAGGGPAAAQYREDLANGLTQLAHNLGPKTRALGENSARAEALEADTRSVDIRQKLAADFPAAPDYRHRLALGINSMANHLMDLGRFPEAAAAHRRAIPLLEKLAADYPGEPRYRESLADTFLDLAGKSRKAGRSADAEQAHREALACWDRLVADVPSAYGNQVEFQFQRGVMLANLRRYPEAEAAYRRVIELKPDYKDVHSLLGLVLSMQGRHAEAVAAAREAVRLRPDDFATQLELGVALARKADAETGDYGEAIACFRRAIALDPNQWQAHLNLGMALERQGQSAAAAAALREAVKLQPDLAVVQNNLGSFLATCSDPRLRDPKQAVAAAKKAVEPEPKNGSFWNTLGIAYYRNGEYPAAVEALGRATELPNDEVQDGGNSYNWFFLAMAHHQLGEKDLARQCYGKAVEWMKKNRPNNVELRRFRAEAEEVLGIPPPPGS
jgi:serine/threonine protein kinase/Flp pilus assembly protein TadD